MHLIYAAIAGLCLITPSGYGTALNCQANPDHLRYVTQNGAGDTHAPSPDTPLAINGESSRPKQDGKASGHKEHTNSWREPIVMVTGAYVVVSFFTLLAILAQGKHIKTQAGESAAQVNFARLQWDAMSKQSNLMERQLTEIGKQTNAIKATAEETRRSVGVQRAAYSQYVIGENWRCNSSHVIPDGTGVVLIEFDIINPTNFPLTLQQIIVKRIDPGSHEPLRLLPSRYLLPKEPYSIKQISFIPRNVMQPYMDGTGQIFIALGVAVMFVDVLGERRPMSFGRYCWLAKGGNTFERFDPGIPTEFQ